MTVFLSELPIGIQRELRKETDRELKNICVTHEYRTDVELMIQGIDHEGRSFCRLKSYPKGAITST